MQAHQYITLSSQMDQERNVLSPRSLVLSLLLGMRQPRRPAHELVAWCGLFGIADGTARVALSRMVRAGELTNRGGIYELAGRVRARGDDQRFALAPVFVTDADPTGWWMELVRTNAREASDRVALRTAMRHHGFAERREGVWLRPANLDRERPAAVAEQCERLRAIPEAPKELAEQMFAPRAWGARARSLRRDLESVQRRLRSADGLADAFTCGTQVVAHLRADPLLPPQLCRPNDRGDALRDAYVEFQRGFGIAVREWFASL